MKLQIKTVDNQGPFFPTVSFATNMTSHRCISNWKNFLGHISKDSEGEIDSTSTELVFPFCYIMAGRR